MLQQFQICQINWLMYTLNAKHITHVTYLQHFVPLPFQHHLTSHGISNIVLLFLKEFRTMFTHIHWVYVKIASSSLKCVPLFSGINEIFQVLLQEWLAIKNCNSPIFATSLFPKTTFLLCHCSWLHVVSNNVQSRRVRRILICFFPCLRKTWNSELKATLNSLRVDDHCS